MEAHHDNGSPIAFYAAMQRPLSLPPSCSRVRLNLLPLLLLLLRSRTLLRVVPRHAELRAIRGRTACNPGNGSAATSNCAIHVVHLRQLCNDVFLLSADAIPGLIMYRDPAEVTETDRGGSRRHLRGSPHCGRQGGS